MTGTKIPQEIFGQIESYMVGTKITLNRWMDGDLNDQGKNTTPDGWMDRELNFRHQQNNNK